MVAYTGSVQEYMSPNPYSVATNESLAAARDMMDRYGVRHLPVLENGKLVGVLSEREVRVAQSLPKTELAQVSVEDVMTRNPYSVSPTAPLTRVAREMARKKYGCAVVMDHGAIAGILTTTDALDALADALEGKHARATFEELEMKPPRGRTRPLGPSTGSGRSDQ